MREQPRFFTLAALTGYTLIIGCLCSYAILLFFSIFAGSPDVLKRGAGLALITMIIVSGLYVWLRRCDARVHPD